MNDNGWEGQKSVMQRIREKLSFSRMQRRAANNLGIVSYGRGRTGPMLHRDEMLEVFDAYYENRQYEHLPPWDQAQNGQGYVPVRSRRPRLQPNLTRATVGRVNSKLLGDEVFPTLKIVDDQDATSFMKAVIEASQLKSRIIEPGRRMLSAGSVFLRFYIVDGAIKVEHYDAKFCYPKFLPSGELESVEIRYVYDDYADLNEHGDPKKKWWKLLLGQYEETEFDNPLYDPDAKELPVFTAVDVVEHDLGFVQGEWLRTLEDRESPDGFAMAHEIRGFVDEFCYNLSQSSQAVGYNQDPQLTLKNVDEDAMASLIRTSMKAWNLGREGEAKFVESTLVGVERAKELRDSCRQLIQDTARVVMMDPEKMVASAQSGKAMEILHGPMLDLIKEIRPVIAPRIKSMVLKMMIATLEAAKQGIEVPIEIPYGWTPNSLDVELTWPPVFQQTITDLKEKVAVTASATSARLISNETGTRFLAKDFGVEDVEEELKRIEAQPIINPFGGF